MKRQLENEERYSKRIKSESTTKAVSTTNANMVSTTNAVSVKYISPSNLYNYINNDHLVDYLKLQSRIDNPSSVFMEKGIDFEIKVVNYLKNLYELKTVSNVINNETVELTKTYMKQQIPIIHSAPIQNDQTQTRGIIDFLVRVDILKHIIKDYPNIEYVASTSYIPYVVIDVKFSTLELDTTGVYLNSSAKQLYYKAQCFIYNEWLGTVQSYKPKHAYILGRSLKYSNLKLRSNSIQTNGSVQTNLPNSVLFEKDVRITNCFHKLGTIDFDGIQSLVDKAIEWYKLVLSNHHSWNIETKIPMLELYPNMKSDNDMWYDKKYEIANRIGELTLLPYCSVKNRNDCISKHGVTSWRDLRCNSELLGIKGKRGEYIDRVLTVNRSDVVCIPNKIQSNMFDWKDVNSNEVFIDFEMFLDIFSPTFPEKTNTRQIFMIGVYYRTNAVSSSANAVSSSANDYSYRSFKMENLSNDAQYKVLVDFVDFMKQLNYPKMWFWYAEKTFLSSCVEQFPTLDISVFDDKYANMHTLFSDEQIAIKGAFSLSLKSIVKAMYEQKMIDINFDGEYQSGLNAGVDAWNEYNSNDFNVSTNRIINEIELYNITDVKSLHLILNYLRTNMM